MRKKGIWFLVVVGVVHLISGRVLANVIAYDGFAYPVGPLAGMGPGVGFGTPWIADAGVMVTTPGLSSPLDMPSTGNAVGGQFNYFAPLTTTLAGSDFWASFLLFHGTVNDQTYMGLTSTGIGPPPEVAFGVQGQHYGIFSSSTPFIPATTPYTAPGSTDFLLTHFQALGGIWQISLYVNPTSLAVPSLVVPLPMTPYNEVLNQNQVGFESDEIRIGTTAFDAGFVPEPGALVIAGITLALAGWRRR